MQNELHIFYKLFVVLYADDTVILSETKEGMQKSLDIFQSYCELWKLQINVNKTKVMVFCKRKSRENFNFMIQGKVLEIVDTYAYLGVVFKYNGTFIETRKNWSNRHKKLYIVFTN